jgi:hypothetical protein
MPKETGAAREGSEERRRAELVVPERLRDRLRAWVDVDAVGSDGFWGWLEMVLPLLPRAGGPRPDPGADPGTAGRVRELARELVDCASDRARLIAECERYYSDNVGLARRVKALEASLRVGGRAERNAGLPGDPEVDAVAERYLPRR